MDSNKRINKEITTNNMDEILPSIVKFIERHEINIKKMSKETGIPRSTLYDFLYGSPKTLKRIQTIISYLGLKISIKPASK